VTLTALPRQAALLGAALALGSGLAGCGLIGGGDRSAFCDQLAQAYPAFQKDPTKAVAPEAGALEWKASFDLYHQRTAKLITMAPGELSGPLTSLQTANDQLAAVYAAAEYDPKQIDAGLVTQLLSDTGYRNAHDAVARYADSTCHIDTGTTSAPTP
jgi:hypothetical protein